MKIKHVFMVMGLAIVVVAGISWVVFPAWRQTPGGVVVLAGLVIAGVAGITRDVVGIVKDMQKPARRTPPQPNGEIQQEAVHSTGVEQHIVAPKGTSAKQESRESDDVKQSIVIK